MWQSYFIAATVDEALAWLNELGPTARVTAGGTDLVLELERSAQPTDLPLVDITRLPGLNQIELDAQGMIRLGALVTHNDVVGSALLRARALPLVQACWQVGSPQIRNRATVAGNVITGSPANDTISPLIALEAEAHLQSVRGERWVPLREFYLGVRRTVMAPDELLTELRFPALAEGDSGQFLKLALRNSQAISVINAAVKLTQTGGNVTAAAITLGAVAPTIIHAQAAEAYLLGAPLTAARIDQAARLAAEAAHPIDDIRSSAAYRQEMVRVAVQRLLQAIWRGEEIVNIPTEPVLLATPVAATAVAAGERSHTPITARINGELRTFSSGQHKTLANLLRDEAGLVGTKIACGEGECGACTIWLDGKAVMSCLVPAPSAHGAEIVTIEGLAEGDDLHPVQTAFIEGGAVQCGFCTPGFVMSAAKLLEEHPNPSHEDILYAISGNLCRCTGYYKIVTAIEQAAKISAAAAA